MKLEVYELFIKVEPYGNDLTLLEIPSYNLLAVHDVGSVVETDGAVCVITVLANQVGSMADAITVNKVFFLDYSLVA
jgi:hypothetical protein